MTSPGAVRSVSVASDKIRGITNSWMPVPVAPAARVEQIMSSVPIYYVRISWRVDLLGELTR